MKTLSMSLFVAGLVLCFVMPCFGMGSQPQALPDFGSRLVAKAEVDECFNGIGNVYKPGPECRPGERKKANQSYLWGLTKSGDNLWFGTAPNMFCMVQAFAANESDLLHAKPYQSELWACEYEEGRYLESQVYGDSIPAVFNDYRAPKIYTYNIHDGSMMDRSPDVTGTSALLLQSTFGLRSAVAYGNYVILAGPMALGSGINMFLFNGSTGAFIGAANLADYQNIRKWLVMDNVLYAAVSKESGGGAVIRYTGTPADPFSFTEVAALDGSGAEIITHNGRIFVGTWPDRTGNSGAMAGIFMSPVVPSGGLTASHSGSWKKVWQPDEYEPDPLGATLYGTGAMASFGGYLYWGTMHVMGNTALSYVKTYDIPQHRWVETFFSSMRSTVVFRCPDFDTASDPDVELLYGDNVLPVYKRGFWVYTRNNMGGKSGRYGKSGFDNGFNNYTWTMAVYNGQLWVGTMDHSYVWQDFENLQNSVLDRIHLFAPLWFSPNENEFGGDLWRFPSTREAAVRFTRDGMGNYTNYGFRSILSDSTGLYLGTANPSNIAQWHDGSLKGGWELWKVYSNY